METRFIRRGFGAVLLAVVLNLMAFGFSRPALGAKKECEAGGGKWCKTLCEGSTTKYCGEVCDVHKECNDPQPASSPIVEGVKITPRSLTVRPATPAAADAATLEELLNAYSTALAVVHQLGSQIDKMLGQPTGTIFKTSTGGAGEGKLDANAVKEINDGVQVIVDAARGLGAGRTSPLGQ